MARTPAEAITHFLCCTVIVDIPWIRRFGGLGERALATDGGSAIRGPEATCFGDPEGPAPMACRLLDAHVCLGRCDAGTMVSPLTTVPCVLSVAASRPRRRRSAAARGTRLRGFPRRARAGEVPPQKGNGSCPLLGEDLHPVQVEREFQPDLLAPDLRLHALRVLEVEDLGAAGGRDACLRRRGQVGVSVGSLSRLVIVQAARASHACSGGAEGPLPPLPVLDRGIIVHRGETRGLTLVEHRCHRQDSDRFGVETRVGERAQRAGGASETPSIRCRASDCETNPDPFSSSTKSRDQGSAASRPRGIPIAWLIAMSGLEAAASRVSAARPTRAAA